MIHSLEVLHLEQEKLQIREKVTKTTLKNVSIKRRRAWRIILYVMFVGLLMEKMVTNLYFVMDAIFVYISIATEFRSYRRITRNGFAGPAR